MIPTVKKTLFIICFFLVSKTWAQEVAPVKKEFLNKYKWDLSLDMYQLLRSGETTVMLKHAAAPNKAYRLAITGGLSRNNIEGLDSLSDDILSSKIKTVGILLGHEWRKNKGKHQLYYGGDVGFSYRGSSNNYPYGIGPSRFYDYSLTPFIGLKYRLLDQLSLSIESGFQTRYQILNQISTNGSSVQNTVVCSHSIEIH